MFISEQGKGFRLNSPATEFIFLSDYIGALEAHLAGRPMDERMTSEYTERLEQKLIQTIPRWSQLSETERFHEHVAAARRQLFSYSPKEYIYPVTRSIARFFVTGGEGYWLYLFGLERSNTGEELKESGSGGVVVFSAKIVTKGYAVLVRVLGLLGICWLIARGQYSVLVLCLAPVLYFLVLHMFEGWSRFRLPVEAPLALLSVYGVEFLTRKRFCQRNATC